MSLVFASFVPHPPSLLNQKEKEYTATREAFAHLSDELFLAHPDTIFIISPHGKALAHVQGISGNEKISTSFLEFGDAITRIPYEISLDDAAVLIQHATQRAIPVVLTHEKHFDYGASIPLIKLCTHFKTQPRIVVITPARNADPKEYIDFGYCIKDMVLQSQKRIALIASGELSHRCVTDSFGGYHKDATDFNHRIREAIETSNTMTLLTTDSLISKKVASCGLPPLLVLFGALSRMNKTPHVLADEIVHGVNYLTVFFKL